MTSIRGTASSVPVSDDNDVKLLRRIFFMINRPCEITFENAKPIGQLELIIRECEGKKIGYVNLYYLIPEKRGLGLGNELHLYALKFFKGFGVNEYHLRVSPGNRRARSFYLKNGMEKVKDEFDGKVIRMKGYL